ncbi:MAG TPA: M20/M25/M40 family metallo-hydrolase [Bacteroidetes bacterium]|nr:M20/M25/M40 family metallo-hydrolase [Bacteroidota bacterium]
MKHNLKYLVIVSLFMLFSCRANKIDEPAITIAELQEHINFLASDELKGRQPGTEGDLKSAEYIRDVMQSWGLKPAVGNGLQGFEIVASLEAGESKLLIDNKTVASDQFMPFAFSENSAHTGKTAFAGYGFDIKSDTLNWNDYEGIDVKGKWVMILRTDPEIDKASSNFARYSSDRDKVMIAKDKGAGGVLMVSGEKFDPKDEFEPLSKGEHSTGIPVLRIKRETANIILKENNVTISELEETLNNTFAPVSFDLNCTVEGISELVEQKVTTSNVLMMLPGNDSILKDEYIIIGGHFDHLGMGGPGSSSRAPDTMAVHYGADDNASGIASMLEIAEKFASVHDNARSIIFAGFTAEEMGLLGSKYLTEHLPVDAEKVNAMINLDMVGRLKENNLIQIGGIGTAKEFRDIVTGHIDTSLFSPAFSEEGYGPSDHSSFYGRDIPVLFFSTGAHLDYHTPYDTPDKISYSGLVNISDLVYEISEELAGNNKKLSFTEAGPKTPAIRNMRQKGVTLGIMPDFAGDVKNGLRADFVTPGRPAALGGMKKGDIITAINGKEINNIQDYMFRLSELEHGVTIQVEVLRDGKKELLLVAL